MSLDIQQREREGIVVFEMNGRVTMGPEATALRAEVAAANAAGARNLVLNMAGVDYIDSTGLGALVICANVALVMMLSGTRSHGVWASATTPFSASGRICTSIALSLNYRKST